MTVRVWPRHLRDASICAKGGRDWFRARNLDWSKFVAEGIDSSVLSATGDPLALRVVAAAEREMTNGR